MVATLVVYIVGNFKETFSLLHCVGLLVSWFATSTSLHVHLNQGSARPEVRGTALF